MAAAKEKASVCKLVQGFGVRAGVQDNVLCIDEGNCIFPVGRALAQLNMETKAMAFVSEGERADLALALSLAPSRRYVAVCERGAEHGQVSVFHVQSQRRHKTLTCLEVQARAFVTAAFSADNKLLAAISDGPDYALVLWLWDKGKLLGVTRLLQPVNRVSFNPSDSSTLGSSGAKFLKLWRSAEGQLKGWNLGLGKREQPHYLDHCWLPDEKLVACTDAGDVCIFEHGELKHSLSATAGASGAAALRPPRPLLCLCPFARGFIVAGQGGAPLRSSSHTPLGSQARPLT